MIKHPKDKKTGRFKRKPGTKTIPAPIVTSGDLQAHLSKYADLPRLAKKIATQAWRGDWGAMEMLIKASMRQAPESSQQYDLKNLTTVPELKMFHALLKKVRGDELTAEDQGILAKLNNPIPAPVEEEEEEVEEPSPSIPESQPVIPIPETKPQRPVLTLDQLLDRAQPSTGRRSPGLSSRFENRSSVGFGYNDDDGASDDFEMEPNYGKTN